MTTVSVTDLTNAKTDVDHIAAIATSTALTATDRLGTTKKTLQGAINSISAITDRGAWTTATAYAVKDVVLDTGVYYICITAHTSGGTFAGDSAKWRVYQGDLGAYHSVDVVNDIRGNDFSNRKMIRIATERGNPVYYLDSADTVSADDDFLVVHDSASNRWKLVHDGVIDVRWAGAVGDGVTDDTTAIQKVANIADVICLTGDSYKTTATLTVNGGKFLLGKVSTQSIISYAGAGVAVQYISSSGSGTRIYSGGASNVYIYTATGQTGLDLDSLSESNFTNVLVAGFSQNGVKLHSSTSGGAVYNRFYNVKAQSCGIGFNLVRDGAGTSSYTNDNTFTACRTNICTTGFDISGGNHNVILESQIEVCTTGINITEPATASGNSNTVALCRFENNTGDISIGAGVVESVLQDNYYVNGDKITDNGTRTQIIGASAASHTRVSGYQIPEGSFRYIRTANGGSQIPHTVFNESSAINSPVTVEIQSPASSLDARALRVRYGGSAGTLKFGIVPVNGKITDLATTNGPVGSFTCAASASTVINNTAITSASFIFLQPANASAATLAGSSKALFILTRTDATSFTVRTGDNTAAAGTEVFFYWIVN